MMLRLQLATPPHRSPYQNPNNNSLTPSFTPLRPIPPSLLSASSPSDSGLLFRQKLLYLEHHLGVDSSRALSLNPSLRSAPIHALRSVADLLLSFGLLPSDASRVLSLHPHLLTADPTADILPVFRFLLGPAAIPFPDLRKSISRCPRLLLSSVPAQLLPALHFLRSLGFVGPRRVSCHTTLLLVSDVEATLVPKLDYLQSLGFSYKETARMVQRSPALLTFSVENNYRPKVEFFTGEMGRDLAELKRFPQYFSFSLEGRIKPRHRMLVENRFSMPLAEMLKVSDGEFRERMVEMRLRSVEGLL